jgi:hypothetical protein
MNSRANPQLSSRIRPHSPPRVRLAVSLAVAILVVSAALAKSKRPPLYDAKASAKADIDAAIQTHLPTAAPRVSLRESRRLRTSFFPFRPGVCWPPSRPRFAEPRDGRCEARHFRTSADAGRSVLACGCGAIGTDERADAGRLTGAVDTNQPADAGCLDRSGRHQTSRRRRSPRPKWSAPNKSAKRNLPDRAWRFGPTATLSGRGDNTLPVPVARVLAGEKQPAPAKRLADAPPPLASGRANCRRRL